MLIPYKRGQTEVILRVKILDSSATTGAGLTGLTFESAGLIISTIADNEETATAYTQAGGKIETIATLGTYATPVAGKCRFKEVDSTNHPGLYEIQLANARYAVANAKSLVVSILGATNCAETDCLIPLVDVDPYSTAVGTAVAATRTRVELALPEAAPDAAHGLCVSDVGGVDMDDVAWKINDVWGFSGQNIWYVDKRGLPANTGKSWNSPYLTIAEALAAASSGDVIRIGAGTWTENVNLSAGGKINLTLEGRGPNATIITNATGNVVAGTDGCVIRNLTAVSTDTAAVIAGISCSGKTDITIERVIGIGNADGIWLQSCVRPRLIDVVAVGTFDGLAIYAVTDGLLERCTVVTDSTYNAGAQECHALQAEDSTFVARDCQFIATRNDGTAFDTIAVLNPTNAVLDNCRVVVAVSNADNTGNAVGIEDGNYTISGSSFTISSTSTTGGASAVKQAAAKQAVVRGCQFAVSATSGDAYRFERSAGSVYHVGCGGSAGDDSGTTVEAVQAASQLAMEANNLDHWAKTACPSNTLANAVNDYTMLAFLMAIGGDISRYKDATESQEALRNRGDSAWTGGGISTTSSVGEVTSTGLTAYQHAVLGAFEFTADGAQTGDSHAFIVYDPKAPGTVVFQLDTAGGDITIGGDDDEVLTVLDAGGDENTAIAGTWCYILRNTTDDTVIADGSLTIEARPDVSS